MIESINVENDVLTIVNPNCDTVLKEDSPVSKLKAYDENVCSTKTEIPHQTRNNNTKFKNNIKIIAKSGTPIITANNVEKLLRNKRILIRSPLSFFCYLQLIINNAEIIQTTTQQFMEHEKTHDIKW